MSPIRPTRQDIVELHELRLRVMFPDGAGLGSLFAVPQDDWQAIANQVALVVGQRQNSDIKAFIPSFPKLLGLCDSWSSTTLPGILASAAGTNVFATDANGILTGLRGRLAGLKAGDPVPADASFAITTQSRALARNAQPHADAAGALAPQIEAFADANKAAHDEWMDAMKPTPPGQVPSGPGPMVTSAVGFVEGWTPIGAQADGVQAALADVGAAWTAIAGQWQALADGTIQITSAGLLDGNLSAAIDSWKRLSNEATAFVSYLSPSQ